MMKNNKIIDEISKIIGDGFSYLGNIKEEIETLITQKIESYFKKMDFIDRQEYTILHDMVSQLRQEQEILKKQVDNLKNHHHD
jgi:BMFP domain-containing protein YqiC